MEKYQGYSRTAIGREIGYLAEMVSIYTAYTERTEKGTKDYEYTHKRMNEFYKELKAAMEAWENTELL